MGELNVFLVIACTLLCVTNIALCVRDILRYEMRSLFGGMLLIFLPIHLYGLYMLPFMVLRPIHEQKFSYYTVNSEWLGFLILNATVLGLFAFRVIMMRNVNRQERLVSSVRPRRLMFDLVFYFTVFYSCVFVLMKRARLRDLISFIGSGNFQGYYNYRKELIYEKATTNFVINNLDSIFVYGMLYFFVGLFAWKVFKYKRMEWQLMVVTPLLIITALLRFQKAPLVIGACVVFLAWIYSRRFSSRMLGNALKMGGGGMGLIGLIYLIYSVLGAEGSIFQSLHDRILLSPAFTSYGFYWTFPEYHDFLHYGGSRTFNLIFGFGQSRELSTNLGTAPLIVSNIYYGAASYFNFNTSILGESYSQNGYLGVAQGTCVLFGVFFLWDYVFLKRVPTREYAPVLIFCFAQFMTIINSGMLSIFSTGFLVIPILYLIACRR